MEVKGEGWEHAQRWCLRVVDIRRVRGREWEAFATLYSAKVARTSKEAPSPFAAAPISFLPNHRWRHAFHGNAQELQDKKEHFSLDAAFARRMVQFQELTRTLFRGLFVVFVYEQVAWWFGHEGEEEDGHHARYGSACKKDRPQRFVAWKWTWIVLNVIDIPYFYVEVFTEELPESEQLWK